jgi:hypothetical protein
MGQLVGWKAGTSSVTDFGQLVVGGKSVRLTASGRKRVVISILGAVGGNVVFLLIWSSWSPIRGAKASRVVAMEVSIAVHVSSALGRTSQ